MTNDLESLLKQKENLKECILISKIGNDSYFLSPLYNEHKKQLFELNKRIEELKSKQNLSTDKRF